MISLILKHKILFLQKTHRVQKNGIPFYKLLLTEEEAQELKTLISKLPVKDFQP